MLAMRGSCRVLIASKAHSGHVKISVIQGYPPPLWGQGGHSHTSNIGG